MQYDLLSILTLFFIEIGQKNETVPPEKLYPMRGSVEGGGGHDNDTLGQIYPTELILALFCIFLWSKNPFVNV